MKFLEQGSSHPQRRPESPGSFLKMQMSGPCSPPVLMKSTQAGLWVDPVLYLFDHHGDSNWNTRRVEPGLDSSQVGKLLVSPATMEAQVGFRES